MSVKKLIIGIGIIAGIAGGVLFANQKWGFLKKKYVEVVPVEVPEIQEIPEKHPGEENERKKAEMLAKISKELETDVSESKAEAVPPVNYGNPGKIAEWHEPERITENYPAPYLIGKKDFDEGNQEFDKISLCWYENEAMTDAMTDSEIDDWKACVGDDFQFQFGRKSENKNVVYIRNERLATDYEIQKIDAVFEG